MIGSKTLIWLLNLVNMIAWFDYHIDDTINDLILLSKIEIETTITGFANVINQFINIDTKMNPTENPNVLVLLCLFVPRLHLIWFLYSFFIFHCKWI